MVYKYILSQSFSYTVHFSTFCLLKFSIEPFVFPEKMEILQNRVARGIKIIAVLSMD